MRRARWSMDQQGDLDRRLRYRFWGRPSGDPHLTHDVHLSVEAKSELRHRVEAERPAAVRVDGQAGGVFATGERDQVGGRANPARSRLLPTARLCISRAGSPLPRIRIGTARPVDVFEIDCQRLLTTQTAVVNQREQCANARIADGAERDLLGIQSPRAQFRAVDRSQFVLCANRSATWLRQHTRNGIKQDVDVKWFRKGADAEVI
jgi:hypothetical protein